MTVLKEGPGGWAKQDLDKWQCRRAKGTTKVGDVQKC